MTGPSLALTYTVYSHFPTFMGDDGVMKWEVPIPMVALVATAVSSPTSMQPDIDYLYSSMPPSTSGVRDGTTHQSSQQIRTWTFIRAILIRSTTFETSTPLPFTL
jgi:hypothetical protein